MAEFDSYVINELGLTKYVRYVDDIVILANNKKVLFDALPLIIEKLKETHQVISRKKTRIDTVYHGVSFLGKVSYPYGYQKPTKQVAIRVHKKAKYIQYDSIENLLAITNSQVGTLKNYNCKKLTVQYSNLLPIDVKEFIKFDKNVSKFYVHREK